MYLRLENMSTIQCVKYGSTMHIIRHWITRDRPTDTGKIDTNLKKNIKDNIFFRVVQIPMESLEYISLSNPLQTSHYKEN